MSNNPHFTPDIRLLRRKMALTPCIGINEMTREIAAETGVSQLDVYAVLKRWSDRTVDAMLAGTKVRMPGLGVFSPTLERKRTKIYFRTASDFKERVEAATKKSVEEPSAPTPTATIYS